jgi:hypothetical protein
MSAMRLMLITVLALTTAPAGAYPLDAAQRTGITRLEGYRLVQQGKARGGIRVPPGALLNSDQIQLRLRGRPQMTLPPVDAEFTRQVVALLGSNADEYGIAVLDLSDPDHPYYAEHRAERPFNPGSVGKLAVAMGLFQALAQAYPDDIAARQRVLRDTQVTADAYIHYDHHKVPFWRPERSRIVHRRLRVGDRANLWTYLDWMLSASSNAAASMVMKQMLLLHHYQRRYPVPEGQGDAFLLHASPHARAKLLHDSIRAGLIASGLNPERLWQGKFFTREGKRRVAGTASHATPRELIRFLLHLEQGKVVDAFTSLELKRLLYMTQKRIRYASSPALRNAAVYFKSGSLYRCQTEPGFRCGKYRGNVVNRLNSVAIVESPAGAPRLFYLVVVTSNVLKENAAVAHQSLATRLQRLLERRHLRASVVEHQAVEADDHAGHPPAAAGVVGQRHGDVTAPVALHQGTVGMPVAPGTRFAVDDRAGTRGAQSLDELVVDPRPAQHRLHLRGQPRRHQAVGLQQIIEPRHFVGGGAMGQVVQRVALPDAGAPVFLADPQTAVAARIVEVEPRRTQHVGDILLADPVEHAGGGAVGRVADHLHQLLAGGGIQRHLTAVDAPERPQQNGDLGQARRVHHTVAVDCRVAGMFGIGNVHQGNTEMALPNSLAQAEVGERLFHALLQRRIAAVAETRIGLPGSGGAYDAR